MAAVDADFIHTWQIKNGLYLNNRFSTQCRGIFFGQEARKAKQLERCQLRGRANRPVSDEPAPARSTRAPVHRRSRPQKAPPPDRAKPRARVIVDPSSGC